MVRTWKHILTKMPLNQCHNCEAKIFLTMTYEQLQSIRHILISLNILLITELFHFTHKQNLNH